MIQDKLSVIIPFCNEHPQAAFTIQNIAAELDGLVNFEIVAIDNWVENPVVGEVHGRDDGFKYLQGLAENHPWLKVIEYRDKLSHWNAKNAGVQASDGEYLWFCDAHCIVSKNSLYAMFIEYMMRHQREGAFGTYHLPLSYMLDAPGRELIYKPVFNLDAGLVHYSFTRYRKDAAPSVKEVPCMSTCGMMMSRDLYDALGGWPSEMGIYGGGEHFINFTLGVLGKSVNIFKAAPLYHYAAHRGYAYAYGDFHRNRTIASWMYGGEEFAKTYLRSIRGTPSEKETIWSTVEGVKSIANQRKHIKCQQKITIREFVNKWQNGG